MNSSAQELRQSDQRARCEQAHNLCSQLQQHDGAGVSTTTAEAQGGTCGPEAWRMPHMMDRLRQNGAGRTVEAGGEARLEQAALDGRQLLAQQRHVAVPTLRVQRTPGARHSADQSPGDSPWLRDNLPLCYGRLKNQLCRGYRSHAAPGAETSTGQVSGSRRGWPGADDPCPRRRAAGELPLSPDCCLSYFMIPRNYIVI